MIACFSCTPVQCMFNWLSVTIKNVYGYGNNTYRFFANNGLSEAAVEGNIPGMEFWLKRGAALEATTLIPKSSRPYNWLFIIKNMKRQNFCYKKVLRYITTAIIMVCYCKKILLLVVIKKC